jgi:multimeric flavodoxin WrbA
MKYLIISGNPKTEGLCQRMTDAVARGAGESGAQVEVLKVERLERCHVCGTGWGTCASEHTCAFGGDGFNEAQDKVREAEQVCLITPVYWWEMAEALKSFLDRLRRCEFRRENGVMFGKPVLLVASAGGTGNGITSCIDQMDRFCTHMGAPVFDRIGVNRWNNDYKEAAVYAAAKAMAGGRDYR